MPAGVLSPMWADQIGGLHLNSNYNKRAYLFLQYNRFLCVSDDGLRDCGGEKSAKDGQSAQQSPSTNEYSRETTVVIAGECQAVTRLCASAYTDCIIRNETHAYLQDNTITYFIIFLMNNFTV